MTLDLFVETLNNHLPKSMDKSKFRIDEDSWVGDSVFLINDRDSVKVLVNLVDDKVVESTVATTGVPFLGITALEMFEHASETLIVSSALIQTFTDSDNTEDYSSAKTTLKILGLLDKENTANLNKSYQRDNIRYSVKTSRQFGTFSLQVSLKGLTNLN